MQKVSFKNNMLNMVGLLFLLTDFDEKKRYPAIVCTHPGGGLRNRLLVYTQKNWRGTRLHRLAFDASH